MKAGPAGFSSIGRAQWQAAAVLSASPEGATLMGPRAKTRSFMRSRRFTANPRLQTFRGEVARPSLHRCGPPILRARNPLPGSFRPNGSMPLSPNCSRSAGVVELHWQALTVKCGGFRIVRRKRDNVVGLSAFVLNPLPVVSGHTACRPLSDSTQSGRARDLGCVLCA